MQMWALQKVYTGGRNTSRIFECYMCDVSEVEQAVMLNIFFEYNLLRL